MALLFAMPNKVLKKQKNFTIKRKGGRLKKPPYILKRKIFFLNVGRLGRSAFGQGWVVESCPGASIIRPSIISNIPKVLVPVTNASTTGI